MWHQEQQYTKKTREVNSDYNFIHKTCLLRIRQNSYDTNTSSICNFNSQLINLLIFMKLLIISCLGRWTSTIHLANTIPNACLSFKKTIWPLMFCTQASLTPCISVAADRTYISNANENRCSKGILFFGLTHLRVLLSWSSLFSTKSNENRRSSFSCIKGIYGMFVVEWETVFNGHIYLILVKFAFINQMWGKFAIDNSYTLTLPVCSNCDIINLSPSI